MIEEAEKTGALQKGKIILEATSGNTGIGLAMVAAVKGYEILLTMSEAVSEERIKILAALGAEIEFTPAHLGTDGAIEHVYNLARENPEKFWLADQFNNEANWMAHYDGTAMEIWEQTEGRLDAIVATMGTTGTLMGISRRFKELDASVQIIGVEPYLGHKIQGLKNMKESYQPGIFEKKRADQIVNIEDEEAFETSRMLARKEGIFVGMSSGAAMAVALKVARNMERGRIVVIFARRRREIPQHAPVHDQKKIRASGIQYHEPQKRGLRPHQRQSCHPVLLRPRPSARSSISYSAEGSFFPI